MTDVWQAKFTLNNSAIDVIEQQLWEVFEHVFIAKPDHDKTLCDVEITYQGQHNADNIQDQLKQLCANANIVVPKISFEAVPDINWLEHVYDLRVPIEAGRFFIHGGHITDYPVDKIDISINAATAFGTGEHGTTKGCLLALDDVLETQDFDTVMDMGCGSGVLAIAAAKILQKPILAVDNDDEAVRVTAHNAQINGVDQWVTSLCSEGFDDPTIQNHGPYNLICANILFEPLMNMAEQMAAAMAAGGVLILSGILKSQETRIRALYEPLGFAVVKTYPINEWQTIVFKK